GRKVRGWRTAALIEHHGALSAAQAGPDDEGNGLAGNPPSYEALRTPRLLYVENADGSLELYDLVHDPDELHNLASRRPAEVTALHGYLQRLSVCQGAAACWAAAHVPTTF